MFDLITPVVLLTFNRLETAQKVLKQIREYKPEKLYLVSDGPRNTMPNERELVWNIRACLESMVDWECDLIKIYASENMGCARRVSSALDYVFDREERAIILEDDCYPADSFFEFCQSLLDEYKDDERIMSIGGSTIINYKPVEDFDYFFTTEFCCCGWATWRRSWQLFDYDMADYPLRIKEEKEYLKSTIGNKKAYWNYMAQWRNLYNSENKGSWAYIFFYSSIINKKLNILSSVNLIKNLGFDKEATHTDSALDYYVTDIEELQFPLNKPTVVERNRDYDYQYYKITQKAGLIIRIKELLGLDINRRYFSKG